MEQHTFTTLRCNIDQSKILSDPLLMSSVQPVPAPPMIKPAPPQLPPPPNAKIYDPRSEVAKFNAKHATVFDYEVFDDNNTQTHTAIATQQAQRQLHAVSSTGLDYDPDDGEPQSKKRRLDAQHAQRFSLQSIGFQPLQESAIMEQLDSNPKLRYDDELRREMDSALLSETDALRQTLAHSQSIQQIYPTSNGHTKQFLATSRGINPCDKQNVDQFKRYLVHKSVSRLIGAKTSKQDDDDDDDSRKLRSSKNNAGMPSHAQSMQLVQEARLKSIAIAKRLGFVPSSLQPGQHVPSGPELMKPSSTSSNVSSNSLMGVSSLAGHGKKTLLAPPPSMLHLHGNDAKNAAGDEVDEATKWMVKNPASNGVHFECKSILKADGSEYDRDLGSKLNLYHRKYDSNFRPLFPVTNKDYQCSAVSHVGLKMLQKYGYQIGDGLGKHKQGVTTFPRFGAQKPVKNGIDFAEKNRKNLSVGFMHCTACNKSFCGLTNLADHILCKKHLKNLKTCPNNLVLLCVQCQLQFATVEQLKQHFILVVHDADIAGMSKLQKELKHELRTKFVKYLQHLQTTENPFKEVLPNKIVPEAKSKDAAETTATATDGATQLEQQIPSPAQHDQVLSQPQFPPPPHKLRLQALALPVPPPPQSQRVQLPVMPAPAFHGQMYAARATDVGIDFAISQKIMAHAKQLNIAMPKTVPNVPSIFCPACNSFFTSFFKFHAHFNSPRHMNAMMQYDPITQQNINRLFQFVHHTQMQRSFGV